MSAIYGLVGFAAGFFFGVGAMLFYVRWRMRKQLGNIEEQMGAISELSEEMSEMMDPEDMEMAIEDNEEVEVDEKKEQSD